MAPNLRKSERPWTQTSVTAHIGARYAVLIVALHEHQYCSRFLRKYREKCAGYMKKRQQRKSTAGAQYHIAFHAPKCERPARFEKRPHGKEGVTLSWITNSARLPSNVGPRSLFAAHKERSYCARTGLREEVWSHPTLKAFVSCTNRPLHRMHCHQFLRSQKQYKLQECEHPLKADKRLRLAAVSITLIGAEYELPKKPFLLYCARAKLAKCLCSLFDFSQD